jgi:SPOR domain
MTIAMADRYQDRPFPADSRGDSSRGDDPLAELARLIGHSDPRGGMGRANQPKPGPAGAPLRDEFQQAAAGGDDGAPAAGPLPWMQRANRQEVPPEDLPTTPHPLQRHALPQAAPEPDFRPAPPPFTGPPAPEPEPDPSRYDDALFGRLGGEAQDADLDQAYSDDGYAYQEGYDDDTDELPRRRGGLLVTAVAVLALAVVGTGGAFAYRTFFGASRSGEPPIIRADAGPTKIMPASADGLAKVPDRMSVGDGTEKIVPREESPVDVDAQSGPRVVLPGLNQNGGLPPVSSAIQSSAPPPGGAGPAATAAGGANGTLSNNEPRRVKTQMIRGDQPDGAAVPVGSAAPPPAKPAAALRNAATASRSQTAAANANASAPLSLVPQGSDPAAEPRTRVAATSPPQTAPGGAGASSGYLVQVSSQRNEADAQASYRALQGKFPAVLGSRAPVIKRADLGDKGVYYRAMVGPFDTPDEATQLCASLKTAGGQCVVQRN